MKIIHTVAELRAWRKTAGSVAFVPTMGNLHAGHLALVAQARAAAEHVVVSVFVNRLQFGQGEDFDQYPRTLEEDAAKLRDAGVSVLFAPSEQELYPRVRQDYQVEPPNLQNESWYASCSTSCSPMPPASAKKIISNWPSSRA